MSQDIVETLRGESEFSHNNPYDRCDHEELLKRAADEIEGLRNKLNTDAEFALAEISKLRNTIAQLRAVAGAVSVEEHSYADTKRELPRVTPQPSLSTSVPQSPTQIEFGPISAQAGEDGA
jgi:hypothetical protein